MPYSKLTDEGKLKNVNELTKEFETSDKAQKLVRLKAFSKFENTTEALAAATALIEGKLSKGLKKFLKTEFLAHFKKSTLAVADSKLANIIKEKYDIQCIHDAAVMELFRGIRSQMTSLLTGRYSLLVCMCACVYVYTRDTLLRLLLLCQ